ncbi:unnamed protein product [Rotaria sp. Silwood2]|nr:unnamed protein product [Rotaria sp. Silwood2]
MLITIGQAIVLVMTGTNGNPAEIGIGICLLIIIQLSVAGFTILLFDELIEKGYALGYGKILFSAITVCETTLWQACSPVTINTKRGTEFEGSIIALFHLLATQHDKIQALYDTFFREDLPNLLNLLATIIVFAIAIYLQSFHVDVPIKSVLYRGQISSYPIRLLHASYKPIILHEAFVSNLLFISKMLSILFSGYFLIDLLGVWIDDELQASKPISGFCYCISPAVSFQTDPVHGMIYIVLLFSSYIYFSKMCVDASGLSANDVTKKLKEQQMVLHDHREGTMIQELNKYISPALVLCGFCITALSLLADLLGTIVEDPHILFFVMVIYQYFEICLEEQNKLTSMETVLFQGTFFTTCWLIPLFSFRLIYVCVFIYII